MRVPLPNDEKPDRRAWFVLAIVCALGAAQQAVIVAQSLAENPFALAPINDAAAYWTWAGEIARGRLVGSTPFFSAPLYPYLLGLVRALGGGLASVYVLQIGLHVATALLLFVIAARRWRPAIGVLAAVVWLMLADPAYCTARVLNCTLQAFVVAWLWERLLAVQAKTDARRVVAMSSVLGLNVLANPTMLLAIPIVALWVAWIAERGKRRALLALATLCVSLAIVAPATLHNYLASGELIPVSAQAGVTFYHGNAPGADGTYHAIAGVSSDRIRQNIDAREMVKGATDGSWNATSRAFFDKGLAYWRSDPTAALWLGARKIYWFASGRNYGDIYVASFEIEDGFASRLFLAPVPVAWCTLPALLAVFFMLRQPRRWLPEILLALLPLATVAAFWYSPRYRFPAMPIVCVLAAEAVYEMAKWRSGARRAPILSASLLLGLALGPLNRWIGFDRLDGHRAHYELLLGNALAARDDFESAADHYRRAEGLGDPDAPASLGDALRRLGRLADARDILRENARAQPASAYAHRALAVVLAESGELDEAKQEYESALALDPNDRESWSGLGNVLRALGRPEDAIEHYRKALALDPTYAAAHSNLGFALLDLSRTSEAEEAFSAAIDIDPHIVQAHLARSRILADRGEYAGAVAALRAGLDKNPGDDGLALELAWQMATVPVDVLRNGDEALGIAEHLRAKAGDDGNFADPLLLDTLAAAQAETGGFDDALKTLERCLDVLRARGDADAIAEVERHRESYRAGRPWRQSAP